MCPDGLFNTQANIKHYTLRVQAQDKKAFELNDRGKSGIGF